MIALSACSSPDDPTDAGRDGSSGRLDSAVVDAGASDAGPGTDATACEPSPIIDPTLLAECPFCRRGRCISGESLPPGSREQLADCSPSHECLPDIFLETGGFFVPDDCRSSFGVEGRCLSTCLPGVMDAVDTLPRDRCDEDHRCVPCFDPRTGESTGACNVSCDPGPREEPWVVTECCEGRAWCVREDLIPEAGRDAFAPCEAEGERCVPQVIASTPGWSPPACTTADAEPGACLHECMPAVMPYRAFLTQQDCPEELLCVPCTSPLDGEPTGACGPPAMPDGGADAVDGGA